MFYDNQCHNQQKMICETQYEEKCKPSMEISAKKSQKPAAK